ncbi:MAG: 3-oxoacyl-(acyl-carrier-protein) synthase [Paraglaciecola sp.]|jgi:3-oxoacyl-(acyl-carrier-protein) synthase
MQKKRVVITGMGVVAPNAIGLDNFEEAIRQGRSGIRHFPELEQLKFGCQIGGIPEVSDELKAQYFPKVWAKRIYATGVVYGVIAGQDAWHDAGFSLENLETDWDSGCVMGAGLPGAAVMRDSAYLVDNQNVKRLGSTTVQQIMSSGISAHLGGMLALGNQVTTNASACSTGSEALILGYERIQLGKAKRMLCGGCESDGTYVWSGFDAMRVLSRKSNDAPEKGSRPMSETAAGFVPGGGAGALVLEDLESALARGARIYGEVLGGYVNSGGQQNGGSITAPNPDGIVRCIQGALQDAGIQASEIDAISGHLTATMFDPYEIELWSKALNRKGKDFPYIASLKSMIGHCLSAAGAIESVAAVLELYKGFLHPSINCEDLHPKIAAIIDSQCIPKVAKDINLNIIAKSSFGFGDVNSVVIFKKY